MTDVDRHVMQQVNALREKRGLSVRKLLGELQGRSVEITEDMIYTLFVGRTKHVRLDLAVAFADFFGVSLDELVRPIACTLCRDRPLRGYTCNHCGSSGGTQ